MLQRNLSTSQRDQAYLNMTRDELQLKQNLVYQLTEATHETNKAFRQISESIVSVGNSIGNGLKLLARDLRGSQQNNNLSYFDQPFWLFQTDTRKLTNISSARQIFLKFHYGFCMIKETWNRRNKICNICHWNTALRLRFCVLNVVYFYDHQMSIVKYFSVDSIKSEFRNKEKVEF